MPRPLCKSQIHGFPILWFFYLKPKFPFRHLWNIMRLGFVMLLALTLSAIANFLNQRHLQVQVLFLKVNFAPTQMEPAEVGYIIKVEY